jgi:hypothetical protein
MINSKVQSSYQKAILFAAKKHLDVGHNRMPWNGYSLCSAS